MVIYLVGSVSDFAIARAMLKDADSILDEATALYDPENEARIRVQSIVWIGGTGPLIVIAHRLSTIMSADQIVSIMMVGLKLGSA